MKRLHLDGGVIYLLAMRGADLMRYFGEEHYGLNLVWQRLGSEKEKLRSTLRAWRQQSRWSGLYRLQKQGVAGRYVG